MEKRQPRVYTNHGTRLSPILDAEIIFPALLGFYLSSHAILWVKYFRHVVEITHTFRTKRHMCFEQSFFKDVTGTKGFCEGQRSVDFPRKMRFPVLKFTCSRDLLCTNTLWHCSFDLQCTADMIILLDGFLPLRGHLFDEVRGLSLNKCPRRGRKPSSSVFSWWHNTSWCSMGWFVGS